MSMTGCLSQPWSASWRLLVVWLQRPLHWSSHTTLTPSSVCPSPAATGILLKPRSDHSFLSSTPSHGSHLPLRKTRVLTAANLALGGLPLGPPDILSATSSITQLQLWPLAGPQTHQARSCPRAFAWAVFFAWLSNLHGWAWLGPPFPSFV